MKRVFVLLIGFLLAAYSDVNCKAQDQLKKDGTQASMQIVSTPGLAGLAKKLTDEYARRNPGIKVSLLESTPGNMQATLAENNGIGLIEGNSLENAINEPLWKTVVGKDIIVPIMNAGNLLIDEICKQGISTAELAKYLGNQAPENWEALVSTQKNTPSHYYILNDETIEKEIEVFVNISAVNKEGKIFDTAAEMLSAIQSDPSAFGFLRLADIVDPLTQSLASGIKLLPVDRNGNGIIDFAEDIYADLNSFTRGVWIGKYPKSLVNNIYTITAVQPQDPATEAFLTWVLTGGQEFLPGSGYSDLLASERQNSVGNITNANVTVTAVPLLAGNSVFRTALLAILAIIAVVVVSRLIITFYRSMKYAEETSIPHTENILSQESLVVPAGLYFDKTHTWAFMDQEGIVTAGVDDFLQHVTGKITRLKLKSAGKKIKKGEHFLSIVQNGKQLDLYSPVSGTIVEANSSLENDASLINSSPYREGWIYKIEPSNWTRENPLLFMADRQKQFISKEFARLRDFLANNLNKDMESQLQVVLQDGGEIRDGVLSLLGPEEWEDFQTSFIDPSRQVWFYEI